MSNEIGFVWSTDYTGNDGTGFVAYYNAIPAGLKTNMYFQNFDVFFQTALMGILSLKKIEIIYCSFETSEIF